MKYDGIVRTRISEVVSMPSSGPTGYVRSASSTAVSGGRDDVHMLESRYIMEGGLSHTQVSWLGVRGSRRMEKRDISLMLFQVFLGVENSSSTKSVAERTGGASGLLGIITSLFNHVPDNACFPLEMRLC